MTIATARARMNVRDLLRDLVSEERRRGLALVAAALTILFLQFQTALVVVVDDFPYFYGVRLYLPDIPLAALIALSIPRAVRGLRARALDPVIAIGVALVGLLIVALLVHPSLLGLQTVARFAGAITLAAFVAAPGVPDARTLIAAAAGSVVFLQAALALAQLARGEPLGLSQLGEMADPLLPFGAALAPRGTMWHAYYLAGIALLAASMLAGMGLRSTRPVPWLLAAGLAMAPVGFTYSRMAALGLALACAALLPEAIRGSGRSRAAIVALVLGAGIPAMLLSDGWLARAEHTNPTELSHRTQFAAQGIELLGKDPIFGIGPGRSAEELRELQRVREPAWPPDRVFPVHNVPLLIAVEAGIPAGLVATALGMVAGLRALRSAAARVAFAAFLPLLMLDNFAYLIPQGSIMLGLWLGWCVAMSNSPPGDEVRARARL